MPKQNDDNLRNEVEKLQAEIKALTTKKMSAEEASRSIIEYINARAPTDPLTPGVENPFGKQDGCSCTIS